MKDLTPPAWMDEAPPPTGMDDYLDGIEPMIDAAPDRGAVTKLGQPMLNDDGLPGHGKAFGGDCAELKRWAFLTAENEFCHVLTGERIGRAAFDLAKSPITPLIEMTKKDGATEIKKLAASKTLIDHLAGVIVTATMYRPDIGGPVVQHVGLTYLNSYLPSSVPQADPDWQKHEAWKIVRDHIRNILPDGADTIIAWAAHNVQFPGRKILWAPVIVGVQGDGKTTIGKAIRAAMGDRNVQTVSPEAMFSDFTGWAEGACVNILEEIRVHGNSRSTAMDKLKPLITNDQIEVVQKGRDGKQVINVTNYMALSNHIDALAIDAGDRRWGVWRTRFENRAQMISEMGHDYWERLHAAIDGHPEVIRGWLLSIDLTRFDRVSAPPMTDAKLAMIEASRTAVDADIREAIALGGFGVGPDVLATCCLNERIKEGGGRNVNTIALAHALSDCGWAKYDLTVKWKGKSRRLYYRSDAFPAGPSAADLRLRLDATDVRDDDRPYSDGPF